MILIPQSRLQVQKIVASITSQLGDLVVKSLGPRGHLKVLVPLKDEEMEMNMSEKIILCSDACTLLKVDCDCNRVDFVEYGYEPSNWCVD